MKKIVSVVLVCLFAASSVQARTLVPGELKDRVSSVAGLYARVFGFYCHALAGRDAGAIRAEAEPLLRDILLELSRPEYREHVMRMRGSLQDSGQRDVARLLDLVMAIGDRDADTGQTGDKSTGAAVPVIISDCISFPAYIFGLIRNVLSNFIPGGSLFWETFSLLVALALDAVLLVLWPLCLLGISAGEVIGFILCPILGVCPP